MKKNQIVTIVLITMSIVMGCKKYNSVPVNQSNTSALNSQVSAQTKWLTAAVPDGISNTLIDGWLRDWIRPEHFVSEVNNTYFPLRTGDTLFYRNIVVDHGTSVEDIYVTTTNDIKVILGIKCKVVHDFVMENGKVSEDTYDWYAQDIRGNVWYFGEDTKAYNDDSTFSTEGSFTAGVDGAKPGIIMPGKPHFGRPYYQEYYKGHAEDQGVDISADNTVTVKYGTFDNCLKTGEYTVIDPGVIENKWYAPGIGLIQTNVKIGGNEHEELIRYVHK